MPETIAQAVAQIKNSASLPNLDESATKQGIVLKLLSIAGWNPFDVSEVVPEYTVGNRRVDYALRLGSANAVFIEVKRPSENLENHQQQLLEYCFQQGVKLAALTNGRTWWLYLPLLPGSWEGRKFLTIDLESQAPDIVEQRFIKYLSQENISSGQAVSAAEELVQFQQRKEITSKALVEAWNQIVDTPDEILVDLISETTERICGFKPDLEMVEQFMQRRVTALPDTLPLSKENRRRFTYTPLAHETRRKGNDFSLPIILDPPNPKDFLETLLSTKEAWIEETYNDGRKVVRHWHARRMSRSSDVINNLRSRPSYRAGKWQELGIVSLRVSIEPPRS